MIKWLDYFDSKGHREIASPTTEDLSRAFEALDPYKSRSEILVERQNDRLLVGIDLTGHFYIVRFWSLNLERSWRERCICVATRAETGPETEIEFDAPNGEGYSFPEKYLLTRDEAFELAHHYFTTGIPLPDEDFSMVPFIP